MKPQHLIMTVGIALLATIGQANAEEKALGKHQVPKAVTEAFEKDHPDAKAVKFEKEMLEGKQGYEAEYKENDGEYESLYAVDGTLLQKEESMDAKDLPEAVVHAVTKAHPHAAIKEAEKLMSPDGTLTGYEVEIKNKGKEIELHLDTNGEILKTERE
ncbi:MAG: PepSY-like domain-containing protein [Methylomonas sp.]